MAKRVLIVTVSILLVLTLLLAACKSTTSTTTGTTSTSTTGTTSTTTAAKSWWEAKWGTPNYGGTLTLQADSLSSVPMDPGTFDTFRNANMMAWFETPFGYSSTVSPDEWPYSGSFAPAAYAPPLLFESWEQTDPTTVIAKVRQGVYWQDKEPVNGREFVAADIEYHFDRLFGNGSGFTEPQPILSGFLDLIDDVKALDKYTIEYKFKKPSYSAISQMMTVNPAQFIEAREAVEKYGNLNDWKNAVGTGPWILQDFVQDSNLTYVKNPNYWGFDERYPENQLPYFDKVEFIQIPDASSTLAAMRSGQIDLIYEQMLQTRDDLLRTNPEMVDKGIWFKGWSITLRNDKEPFTDIRVRQALDMAIDRPTIAKEFYKGTVDGYPASIGSPGYPGWFTPWSEWPQDLKDQFTFNPEGAKALLAEAGHSTIDTYIDTSTSFDIDLLQIVQSNFKDIGVNMEIRPMEWGAFDAYIASMTYDQMAYSEESGLDFPPFVSVLNRHSTMSTGNISANNDPVYDKLAESFADATTEAGAQKIFREVELYTLSKHWDLYIMPQKVFTLWQPTLKGYSGNVLSFSQGWNWARMWK
jgi:peptide/nickel transport system substrate-binding protein